MRKGKAAPRDRVSPTFRVASLFQARDSVLTDAEQFRRALLRQLARLTLVSKRHFLRQQFVGSCFNLGAAAGRQFAHSFLRGLSHRYFLSFTSFFRPSQWVVKRLSAFLIICRKRPHLGPTRERLSRSLFFLS